MTATVASAPAAAAPATGKTYYLVDGSGYIFRAFHALPMMNRRSDGTPTNAVYGFTTMLMKLLTDVKAEYLAVVFDAARRNFRNDIYPDYKANRGAPPEELAPQFPLIREAAEAFNLCRLEIEGYEADDVIATYARLAREEGSRAVIVSSDKDLMQLIATGVSMYDPIKDRAIDVAEVIEKFGVPPSKVAEVQALAGDSVDNVPGVPGIGVKTAAQLITEFGSLEALLTRAPEITQPKRRAALIENAEKARISHRLVLLDDQVKVPASFDDFRIKAPDRERLFGFLKAMEFRSVLARAETVFPAIAAQPRATVEIAADSNVEAVLLRDLGAVEAWVARAQKQGRVAIGVHGSRFDPAAAELCGVTLAVAPGEVAYVALGHRAAAEGTLDLSPLQGQLPRGAVLERLKPLFEDPSVVKIGHDAKYDWHMLAREGIALQPLEDIQQLSYVLDGAGHAHDVDALADLHLGRRLQPLTALTGTGKGQLSFDLLEPDKAGHWAAARADALLALYDFLRKRLVRERTVTLYERIDRPLVPVVAAMEHAGIRIDRGAMEKLSVEFGQRMAAIEAEIYGLAGHEFNIGSPKQLGTVLFDEMGLPGGEKTKAGAYSTHSDVLEPLAAGGHGIAQKVLDWRQIAKLKGTYTDALPGAINPRTGRVHTSFALAATNTGRLSSNDPNLQNIPIRNEEGRRIRHAFIAAEGHRLVSVDYSQIELRLVAEIAKVAALQQAFRDGLDIHAATASQVFGVPLDQMTPDIRRKAKAINFGIIYGISGWGLAAQLGIAQGEATAFIKEYLQRYGELKAWMDATKVFARQNGHVLTLFGRRVIIPGIKDPNPARRNFAERQAINAPIQGTAADIIKRAMVRLPPALARAGLGTRLLLQVHDELLFEAPEAEVEATIATAKTVMEGAAMLGLPLVADAGSGHSWAEAH